MPQGEAVARKTDNKLQMSLCNAQHVCCVAVCSDVDAGGETYFRRSTGCPVQSLQCTASPMQLVDNTPAGFANRPGLRIPPKQGRAIMFWYTLNTFCLGITNNNKCRVFAVPFTSAQPAVCC